MKKETLTNLSKLIEEFEGRGESDKIVDLYKENKASIIADIEERNFNKELLSSIINSLSRVSENDEAISLARKWLSVYGDDSDIGWMLENLRSDVYKGDHEGKLTLYGEADRDIVLEHIEREFGHVREIIEEGLEISKDIKVDICVIDPREDHDYFTLVTLGMGAYVMNIPDELKDKKLERVEIIMNLPNWWEMDEKAKEDEVWNWPIRIMRQICRIPQQADSWIGWGHTIGFSMPFCHETKMNSVLLLAPGSFDESSYFCKLDRNEEVNFYQAIPLYEEELNFKIENDVEKLIERMPGEYLEVVLPIRSNFITEEEQVGLESTIIDDGMYHVQSLEEKHLELDPLTAYNHLAIYLRWAIEKGLTNNMFNKKHEAMINIVKANPSSIDLRQYIRDSEDMDGKLYLNMFNYTGSRFSMVYYWTDVDDYDYYPKDVDMYAESYFGTEKYNSDEFQDEAYLFVPYDEDYYRNMSEIIEVRFNELLADKDYSLTSDDFKAENLIKEDEIKELFIPENMAEYCSVTSRVIKDGKTVGKAFRAEPDAIERGWNSGWYISSGDEDDAYLEDDNNINIVSLNTACNYCPDIIPFLERDYGSLIYRNEQGILELVEDDEGFSEIQENEISEAPYEESLSKIGEGVEYDSEEEDEIIDLASLKSGIIS